MTAKLYLIDGSGYVFRAYFGMARDRGMRLVAQDGTPTNAVYAFNQMLQRLLKDVGATDETLLGIAFDNDKPTFRDELYPAYKGTRDAMPEDLVPQVPLIHELVEAYDIPLINVDGYEADDVIATLACEGRARHYDVTIVSADKDLMQLVIPGITMWDPMRDVHYDREAVKAKYGVYPEQLGDYLALVGDAVDNVPGVPKVGKKTAEELITQFGSLDAILERAEEIQKKGVRETVMSHKAEAILSKKLVTLCSTVPNVALDDEKLKYTGPLREKIEPLFKRLSFSDKRVEDAMATAKKATGKPALAEEPLPKDTAVTEDPVSRDKYITVTDITVLERVCANIVERQQVAIDTETTSLDPMQAEIVGIALAWAPGEAAYVPVSHRYLGVPKQLTLEEVHQRLSPVLANPAVRVMGQNLKYDLHVLKNAGFEVAALGDDAMLLSYVLDPGRESHRLDYLARINLGHENIRFDSLVGKGKAKAFDEVTVEQATAYSAEDADVALRLCALLKQKLGPEQKKLYEEVEMPLSRVLFDMEHRGILVAPERLSSIGADLQAELKGMMAEIVAIAGSEININSPKQLADLLFVKLGLPVIKKTKTGPSTDMSVLEQLAEEHPLPRKVLDLRQVQKLLSTYVESLPTLIHPRTGRVHTSFNQALAATGRLSSADPNLQNIPIKSERGRRIRSAFVAARGEQRDWSFISADYSQVELRMLAHLSGDEALKSAFSSGTDIHQKTAVALFSVAPEAVTADMRRRAKTVNFGLLYGLSAFRLSREEKVSIAEAKAFIDAYFNAYPSVRGFIDKTLEEGRAKGYVETLLGRRRYLPDLRSKNHAVRQGAERVATNTPIQGSAADLIKVAMLKLDAALKAEGFQARMLLQVHDELVLEAPNAEIDTVSKLVRKTMEGAMTLDVPLEVGVTSGADWSLVH
jgi:DNA polymerase I